MKTREGVVTEMRAAEALVRRTLKAKRDNCRGPNSEVTRLAHQDALLRLSVARRDVIELGRTERASGVVCIHGGW